METTLVICERGSYRAELKPSTGDPARARAIVRAWGTALLSGAAFTMVLEDSPLREITVQGHMEGGAYVPTFKVRQQGPERPARHERRTWEEVAALFGIESPQPRARRSPEEAAAARLDRLLKKYPDAVVVAADDEERRAA